LVIDTKASARCRPSHMLSPRVAAIDGYGAPTPFARMCDHDTHRVSRSGSFGPSPHRRQRDDRARSEGQVPAIVGHHLDPAQVGPILPGQTCQARAVVFSPSGYANARHFPAGPLLFDPQAKPFIALATNFLDHFSLDCFPDRGGADRSSAMEHVLQS